MGWPPFYFWSAKRLSVLFLAIFEPNEADNFWIDITRRLFHPERAEPGG